MAFPFKERISRLISAMESSGISGAIVSPGTNLFYLTGLSPSATLERLFALLISSSGEVKLLAPKLYESELKDAWMEVIIWSDSQDPYAILSELIQRQFGPEGRIAIDDNMQASHILRAYGFLRRYDLKPLSALISALRMVKDDAELSIMREAARIADRTLEKLMSLNLRGKSEKEVARLIQSELVEEGADAFSFDPIVASGPNGANPHHTPTTRRISEGDVLIVDFGAKYRGYCSDITRTLSIGKPTQRATEVYEIVREAQESAFKAVKEGVAAKEVDAAARSVITNRGYGERFTHRTGHGLGLDIHEEPYIAPNSEVELKNGMVFTIEPGIYLEGEFGVRIEDDVAVINGRGERFTKTTREFIVI